MIARWSLLKELVALCAMVGGLLFVWSAPALAQRMHEFSKSFGSEGSGEGQLMRPGQLAVNAATGDVYVIDRGNKRVEIFNASGGYVGQFNGGASPTGAFAWLTELDYHASHPYILHEGSIAVDNSTDPLDPSKGDVYVTDEGHNVIDKFTASGTYVGQVVNALHEGGSPFPEMVPMNIAVDPDGALWVQVRNKGFIALGARFEGEIYEYNDALTNEYVSQIVATFPSVSGAVSGLLGIIGLAFDSEGHLYTGKTQSLDGGGFTVPVKFTAAGQILDQGLDGEETSGVAVDLSSDDVYADHKTSVAAYDPSGSFVERFGSGEMQASNGIAVDSATGTVYTSDATNQEIDVFTAFTVPDATTGGVSSFGETSVTVGGKVNPDGLPVTSCVFEYGTSASYGQSEPCSTSPGSGGSPVAVSARLTGLDHLTSYHYRLKVANAHGSNVGQDRTFLTPEPVALSEEGVSDVSSGSALFSALVNPGGADTMFHFEYGTSASYGESAPVPDGDLGAVTGSEQATVRAQDLLPNTTYHVRLVANNALGTVYGPDETFTTQAGAGAFALPDGRAWELVSPPSKEGASIEPMWFGAIEASEEGGAITYIASGPIDARPQGNPSPLGPTQVLSKRGADGWSSEDIATPHDAAEVGGAEYRAFSPDLSRALLEPAGETPLAPEATERTGYVRDNANGSYVPLVTANDVAPGTQFGAQGGVKVLVGTPDLSHVILTSEGVRLTSDAIGNPSLYEWSGGQLQLVNILPDGTAAVAGYLGDGDRHRHALSNDGSRVFWEGNGANVYMRDTVAGKTVEVDAPAPGVSLPPHPYGNAVFQIANANGSKVFFRDTYPLTLDSKLPSEGEGGRPDLYVCQIVEEAGEPKCDLTDLSVDPHSGEQADVQEPIVGASEDGSVVYFIAGGKLAEGAESGQENLYVESESGSTWSAPRLVAVLSGGGTTSKVSPNGRYLAFMSDKSLTGYDNRDANSGQPDEEVFLYDEATGRLNCASCNPTGARPNGIFDPAQGIGPLLIDRNDNSGGHWLAGSVPGPTAISDTGLNPAATYLSRYLSDEGRLFFDSPDALVAQDTNGKEDVYEYEPPGVGGSAGCTTAAATYVASAAGCVSLISSGTSAEESAFMDASAIGNDVFILTAARLTSRDVDTSLDMYDAHVCSGGAPCVSSAVSPPPCSSGDSCKVAPSPQPAIFGAPSSATFSGAGNVAPSSTVGASAPKRGAKKKSSHGKPKPRPRRRRRGKGRGARVHKSLSARTRR
ncbi:MAG TPA: hypothetical protein VNY52_01240 [Solirubrobacteraceae bacterium]|jgi:hypothetical protein|nr:hypothetical protein [Solirubrobacteraceae bacterium]